MNSAEKHHRAVSWSNESYVANKMLMRLSLAWPYAYHHLQQGLYLFISNHMHVETYGEIAVWVSE